MMDSKRLVEGAGICIGEAAAPLLHPMERGQGGAVARPPMPHADSPSASDGERARGRGPLRARIETIAPRQGIRCADGRCVFRLSYLHET